MSALPLDDKPITVILADGDPPSHSVPLSILNNATRVVACDGAWRTAVNLGRVPDAIVGDGDSLISDDMLQLEGLCIPVIKDAEQDTNDLCKAFRYVLRFGDVGHIVVLGATGKREDHTIGNIFHLIDFAEVNDDVSIVTDSGIFEPIMPPGRDWNNVSSVGQPISVFASHPDTTMTSVGLKWSLDSVRFDMLWRGTLNRITSSSFSIHTDRPAIVFHSHF